MGCFLVSAAAAIGVSAAKYVVRHNEKKGLNIENKEYKFGSETKWSTKLNYLELTLWGGSFMLAGEHILHGEVTPFPPFLTAAQSPEDTVEMLHEMGTVGVTMLLALVSTWAIGTFIYDYSKYKKHVKQLTKKEQK